MNVDGMNENKNIFSLSNIFNLAADYTKQKGIDNTQSKSLNEYMKRFKPKYAIRISDKNFGFENGIKSVPLYATFLVKWYERFKIK